MAREGKRSTARRKRMAGDLNDHMRMSPDLKKAVKSRHSLGVGELREGSKSW